jgi:hypothetical protein
MFVVAVVADFNSLIVDTRKSSRCANPERSARADAREIGRRKRRNQKDWRNIGEKIKIMNELQCVTKLQSVNRNRFVVVSFNVEML